METFKTIMSRRSIRKFKNKEISDDVLRNMLEAARFAPSWANTQCSRFIVVRDSASKEKITEAFPPRNPGFSSILTAPVVIIAFAEKFKSGFYKGEASTNKGEYWYMFDVALALQNMVLTAWENGIGSVYLGLFDANKLAKAFNIPNNYEVVAVLPFGYPDEEPKCPPRKSLSEIVYYEAYSDLKDE